MAIRSVLRVKNLSKTYFLAGIGRETNRGWTQIAAQARAITTVPHKSKSRDWNEIVQDAEKLVGYEEYRGANVSLGSKEQEKGHKEDIQSVLNKLSRLVTADSPLLEIAKNFEPRSSIKGTSQVRGLIVLLVAKLVAEHSTSKQQHDTDECDSYGLTPKQRLLAQITEMIYTARLIHRTVINLPGQEKVPTPERSKLEFNNKVAILIGDYLLAKASLSLGNLRNTKVLEMISGTIRNFSEMEFMYRQDLQGKPYPTPVTTIRDWEVKAYLSFASVLSNSCRAVLGLAAEDEVPQVRAFEFGKQLGLVWQIHDEMQPFTDVHTHSETSAFDLMSIPMIMHLKNDPTILSHILPHHNCLDNVDYAKIRSLIRNGTALKESLDVQHKYAQDTLRILNQFGDSECRNVLQDFVTHLSDC